MTATNDRTSAEVDPREIRAGSGSGLGVALRRYWIVVLLLAVIGGVVGGAIGTKRKATYTAQASLNVGRIDLSAPGALAGYTQATVQLTDTFSREVLATPVVTHAARAVGASVADVRSRISSAPITQTSVFQITATANTAHQAVTLANAASRALVSYINSTTVVNPAANSLYQRYVVVARRVAELQQQKVAADKRFGRQASDANGQALAEATAVLDGEQLRLEALGQNYQAAQGGLSSAAIVEPLAEATTGISDHKTRLEQLIAAGLAVGLLIGFSVAVALASRRAARDPV